MGRTLSGKTTPGRAAGSILCRAPARRSLFTSFRPYSNRLRFVPRPVFPKITCRAAAGQEFSCRQPKAQAVVYWT